MSLLTSVIGAADGRSETPPQANPLISLVGSLITQSGGLQGLMSKFSQAGLGSVFSSWVSSGPNPPVSGQQIQDVLGSDQIAALAAKLGISPAHASQTLADHLPTVVDELTPEGKIDPGANIQQNLVSMIPSLLQKFTSQPAMAAASQR